MTAHLTFALWTALAAAGAPTDGPAAGREGPRPPTAAEAGKLAELTRLAQAGSYDDLLKRTLKMKLKEGTYAFKRGVLLLQADAFRRGGKGLSAMNTVNQLIRHAARLPDFQRKKEVQYLVFLSQLYRLSKTGHYRSPARRDTRTTTAPQTPETAIANDANWEKAKDDYAEYLLGRLDPKLKRLARITTPAHMERKMYEALGVIDMVRRHRPEMANAKTVEVVEKFVERFGRVVEDGNAVRRAKAMVDGSLLRQYGAVNLDHWKAITGGILRDLRGLYVDSYNWGRGLLQYARREEIVPQLEAAVATMKGHNDTLKRLFVEADNFVHYKVLHRALTAKHAKNDPLSKIPTAPW